MVGLGSMRVKILSDDSVLSSPKINGSVNLQSGWPMSAPTSSI